MKIPEEVELPPDCEVVIGAIWDYLDGRVDPDRLAEIEDHLASCDYCLAHTEFQRRLVQELSGLRGEHSDPTGLRARVMEAIRTA